MKRTIIMLAASIVTISAFSQQFVCPQDTVQFYQTNYRGKLSWQKSENGIDWSQVPGSQGDTLLVVATSPAFYRTEVVEGACMPYYSDVINLIVNELPIISLELKDSLCLNENAFILTGGVPSGGSYWGDGVFDGKYSPIDAGPGRHQVYYSYTDSLTGCSNTAFTFITVAGLPNQAQAGKDTTMVFADSVFLEANDPENAVGTWTKIQGSNGHFSDVHSPKTWFINDSRDLSFTFKWTISGYCGSSSDEIAISFIPLSRNACPNAPTVTDADGNIYPTVQIGDRCWMAKNLNVGRYVTSTVRNSEHSNLADNSIIEKYCFENNIENCRLYGGLYDWDEAMGYSTVENTQGICPEGWHIPGNSDWANLSLFYKLGDAGEQMKVGGSSGFEGYFAGDRHAMGEFYAFGAGGYWWQSASYNDNGLDEGVLREIAVCKTTLAKSHFTKKTGLSVRCVKNR